MTTPFDEWYATKRQEAKRLSWARLPEGFSGIAAMNKGYDLLDLLEAALAKAESGTDARVA